MARNPDSNKIESEEWKDVRASLAQAHESQVPLGVPVVLLTKKKKRTRCRQTNVVAVSQRVVGKISNPKHIVTQNNGHGIPFEEPELVIKTIQDIVTSAR